MSMPLSESTNPYVPNWGKKGGYWRLSVAHFLVALVLLLVTLPFVLDSPGGKIIEAALFTLVFLSGVLAVGGRHRTLFVAVVLVIPVVAGTWLQHFHLNIFPNEVTLATSIIFSSFVIIHLLRFTLEAPRVDSQVLCAGISIYLMLAVIWSFAYLLVAHNVSKAFALNVGSEQNQSLAPFDAVYFSFCTLTTLGYGDIVPVARIARQLAILEATTGTLYVTVLIARLVSLYSTAGPVGSARDTPVNAQGTSFKESNR
jgi:Ion channel